MTTIRGFESDPGPGPGGPGHWHLQAARAGTRKTPTRTRTVTSKPPGCARVLRPAAAANLKYRDSGATVRVTRRPRFKFVRVTVTVTVTAGAAAKVTGTARKVMVRALAPAVTLAVVRPWSQARHAGESEARARVPPSEPSPWRPHGPTRTHNPGGPD